MKEARRSGLSIFDDMLAQNRKSFDELYRREPGEAASSRAAKSDAAPSGGFDLSLSVAARRLNERFGNDWRFEIVERQRKGDEAIILCKLTFGKDGAVRTQFGRAKIQHAPIAGAAGGVRFKVGVGAGAAADEERRAFRRATEAALTNCIDMI